MDRGGGTQFVAVGDWFEQSRMTDETRARPGVAALMEELRAGDIAFLNLEIPLATRGVPQEKQNVVKADPNLVEDLVWAGVDVACLANNHMMDYGWDGVEDTITFLERAGIKHIGAGRTIDVARAPLILDGPGGKIGLLAFTSIMSQSFMAGVSRPGLAGVRVHTAYVVDLPVAMEAPGLPPPILTMARDIDVQATEDAVRALKKQVDFVVVSAHWGGAGDELMDYQHEVGQALVDAGADMIVGHHSHRLQGVQHYHGKPIFYGMGNFVFGPQVGGNYPENSFRGRGALKRVRGNFRNETVVLNAWIRGNTLERVTLLPGIIDKDGYPEARPDLVHRFVSLLEGLSEGLGTEFRAEGGRVIVAPA